MRKFNNNLFCGEYKQRNCTNNENILLHSTFSAKYIEENKFRNTAVREQSAGCHKVFIVDSNKNVNNTKISAVI